MTKEEIMEELASRKLFSVVHLIEYQKELNINSPEVLWELFDKVLDKRARRSLVFR